MAEKWKFWWLSKEFLKFFLILNSFLVNSSIVTSLAKGLDRFLAMNNLAGQSFKVTDLSESDNKETSLRQIAKLSMALVLSGWTRVLPTNLMLKT